jgi:hypothetical protein
MTWASRLDRSISERSIATLAGFICGVAVGVIVTLCGLAFLVFNEIGGH